MKRESNLNAAAALLADDDDDRGSASTSLGDDDLIPATNTTADKPGMTEKSNMANVGGKAEQRWFELDLGGCALRSLSLELFHYYTFLKRLSIPHNLLLAIPPAIARLQALEVLDVSSNRITALAPEIGMCTNLRELLVFDNAIRELPWEFGNLYQLQVFGLEGNPVGDEVKLLLYKDGTRGVIDYLRDQCPKRMISS